MPHCVGHITVETSVTSSYLPVACLDVKIDHTQIISYMESVVKNKHHMQVIMAYCYVNVGS